MRDAIRICARIVWAAGFICSASAAAAVEGSAAAGPVGGTDIRAAMLPPPGLYGGLTVLGAKMTKIVDGAGRSIPGSDVDLTAKIAGPFLGFVPNVQVLGGSIGVFGVLPGGQECGHVLIGVPSRCASGIGDPYIELAWSRSFGRMRPSQYRGALPIFEGLTIGLGIGAVIPIGQFNAQAHVNSGVSIGNKIFDLAPSVALTYTTAPLIAEGTEFSMKFYWNNYWTNSTTQYSTGALVNVDFAISERIGRFQAGLAGFYAQQIEDDRLFGVVVPPDGRRLTLLALGGVLNYDLPEYAAAIRLKAITTAYARNAGVSHMIAISSAMKLY